MSSASHWTDTPVQTGVSDWIVDVWIWITVSIDYWVYVAIDWVITTYPPSEPYVIWIAPVFGIPTTAFDTGSSPASSSASATAAEVVQRAEGTQDAFGFAGPNTFLFLVFVLAIVAIVAIVAITRRDDHGASSSSDRQ